MNTDGSRQFLFVLGCIVCLLAVASALPAADPRLEPPGTGTGTDADVDTTAGDWESVQESADLTPDPADDADSESSTDDNSDRVSGSTIEIDGALEPGNEVTIDYDSAGPHPFEDSTVGVAVNGESVGTINRSGEVDAIVPYAEEMTITVPEEDVSRTVDVETTATIELEDGPAPGADVEVLAVVGSTPVEDATVSLDGESVATTDEDGNANVTLPDTAGPAELRVERDPVAGERTIEVPEPQVAVVSPLMFPKFPAPIEVSADGTPVQNATVSLENGGSATTDSDGRTSLQLPIADEVTVTASVGEETATTTVEDLYLRAAVIVVLGLGFLIGTVVTYVRFVVRSDARHRGSGLDGLVADLAVFFELVGSGFSRVGAAGSRFASGLAGTVSVLGRLGTPSAPSSAPALSLSVPRFAIGGGWQFPSPSIGSGLASFGRAFGSMPSFGSLFGSSDRDGGSRESRFSIGEFLGGDDDDDETTATTDADRDPPTLADEPFGPRGPRAEIRAAWHAFLDRLAVTDRETLTPGQAARRALADGFPSERVSRLVSIVRDVEYGSREPSPDRVLEARDTATDLIDHEDDGDEEGSE